MFSSPDPETRVGKVKLTLYVRDSFFTKMAVDSQSQAPLRYMAVPEKIELGGGGGGGGVRDPSGGGGRYRPMKVLKYATVQ